MASDWSSGVCSSVLGLLTLKWIVTNFIVCLLHVIMLKDRVKTRHVVSSLIVQEVIVFVIGIFLPPDSPSNLVFLLLSVFVYEWLRGEKIVVKDHVSFVSDLPCEYFKNNGLFEASTDGGKLQTNLKCLVMSTRGCHLERGSLPLDSICSVDSEVQQEQLILNLIKMGFEVNKCFQVTTCDEDTKVCLDFALVADSFQLKDRWVNIVKTWVGLLDEDVQKIWLRRLLRLEEEDAMDRKFTIDDALQVTKETGRIFNPLYFLYLFEKSAKLKHGISSMKYKVWKDDKVMSKVKLDWNKFVDFFKAVVTPEAMEAIFKKIPGRRKRLNILPAKSFHCFLRDVQMETEQADNYLEKIDRIEPVLKFSNVSVIGLSNYFLEEEQSIFNHHLMDVMDQPLSHYYIASSHNTYLTKDQLKSKSSVDMYIKALQRGCKCLELDCWDGSDNEPVIYHGYTLTSKILFKDVILAIKEHAFARSPYPVILSFEIHCSVEQQKVMVRHLKDILGEMLYLRPIPADECNLPSPEELKGYILIKAKKIADGLDEGFIEDLEGDLSDDDLELTETNILKELSEHKESDLSDIISICSLSDEEETNLKEKKRNKLQALLNDVNLNNKSKNKKACKIAKELSDLVVYCQAKRFKNFDCSRIEDGHFEMCSLQEKKALKLVKESSHLFVKHNGRHLIRVYPSGYRIDSSNYNPIPFWNVGCQLVALNYQTASKEMQLNQGLFQMNKCCGYVLKPQFLRDDESSFDPQIVPTSNLTISIRIISGHQLPFKYAASVRNERNYFVQTRIFGVEADCQSQQTIPVKNNGFNPLWDEVFVFKIHVPELAVLMFTVYSKVFVAQYSLPIRSLRQGCRRVPLLNKHSEMIKESFLLVHVEHV